MKNLNIKIDFGYEDGSETTGEFVLTVPYFSPALDVVDILKKEHEYLSKEDQENIYALYGKVPETLLDYVCEKYGWHWRNFGFDIEMKLDNKEEEVYANR